MKRLAYGRCALGICAIIAVLSGCGGWQGPIGAPGANPQNREFPGPESPAATRVGPASSYEILHRFHGRDGAHPTAALLNVNGTLYGTASSAPGVVYSISPTGKEKVLHRFHGLDGNDPQAGLINVKGTLYGTTYAGGAYGEGTVFSITTTGTEKVLYNFSGSDGKNPEAGLTSVKGALYGTTYFGGLGSCSGGCGTVFSVTTSGTEKMLHSFGGGSDGASPYAGLADVNGTLYGTTVSGGAPSSSLSLSRGTVFSITTSGKEKVVYSFGSHSADGAEPYATLINVNGLLYGTTPSGGSGDGCGTVFSVTRTGTEKTLYTFCSKGNRAGGVAPRAALVNANDALYGTTTFGGSGSGCGSSGCGVVFRVTMAGKERVLHTFGGGSDGSLPVAGLINIKGGLYGTTWRGGGSGCGGVGCGIVFALTPLPSAAAPRATDR